MPRTKLDRFSNNQQTYRAAVNCVVESAMKMAGIKTWAELGEKLGYSKDQIANKRYRGKDGFSAWDLYRMNRFLPFSEHQRKLIFGEPLQ